jgi:hypothetical protein
MIPLLTNIRSILASVVAGLILLIGTQASGAIQGITGTNFNLVARQDRITLGDGDSMLMWGYANGAGRMQYPGPTLILQQGVPVTVTLTNELPAAAGNVSIVFPGHLVTAAGGVTGALTQEAVNGDPNGVTYSFTPTEPGTYMYHSGTRPDLQVEMGLVGAIVVRSTTPSTSGCPDLGVGFNNLVADPRCLDTKYAYNHVNTGYQREFLFFMTDLDPKIHRLVEFGRWNQIDTTEAFATCWFLNGRNFPDTLAEPAIPWLPTQPYNISPIMRPGETILARLVTATRDPHPLHFHGNHARVIAKDGRMLSSGPGNGPNLSFEHYTVIGNPGETVDCLFTWNGEGIGWDVYGHAPGDPQEPYEYSADHGTPFPVILPARDDLVFGQFYSGSPFLGSQGSLPPGHPGLNSAGGFFFMWHSHTEKELSNNNIFPGGLITLLNVVPWTADLPAE